MAAWIATEFWSEFKGTLGISLTPVDGGRLEVMLENEMLFDRVAEGGAYPGLDKVRAMKRTVKERMGQLAVVSR
ncbi:MAG: hypothetical protein EXR53_02750 [Dehalococcoidia bacterium]|nr:hypothetical protein [Dehalococcoidia bacterium]